MNYYERVQRAIDHMEASLDETPAPEILARLAMMSSSSLYRLFFAMVGYPVKAYLRMRRVHEAARMLRDGARVLDVALASGYESVDAFSRAFRRTTGMLPSVFRGQRCTFVFERVDLMTKYFNLQEENGMDEYPDIRLLKEMPKMRVASALYYGRDPETHAFALLRKWMRREGLSLNDGKSRIFGFNNPSPMEEGQQEYGYEVCLTIGESQPTFDADVRERMLSGGQYAVMSISGEGDMGQQIMAAWGRFNAWLAGSRYTLGMHQWMEEHLGFDEENQHIGGVDLYMPIRKREAGEGTFARMSMSPMRTLSVTAHGKDAIEKARADMMTWLEESRFFDISSEPFVFAYYPHLKLGTNELFCTIHVAVPEGYQDASGRLRPDTFDGGEYLVGETRFMGLGMAWSQFLAWMEGQTEYGVGAHWFMERYRITAPEIRADTPVTMYMPVSEEKD